MSFDEQVHEIGERRRNVVKTQHGIIKVAEEMALILAEMGRASNLAIGDPPLFAIGKWVDIIHARACEIYKNEQPRRHTSLPAPKELD